ncbi:MAG: DUF4325 domain-containing protein [Selenomonadaceae bacterium]|nr:DUF4325 domain-containing protein [Selenomonadaceae bacterium]
MKFSEEKKKNLLFQIAKKMKYLPNISVTQLSEELHISRTVIYKYIKFLEDEGIIFKTQNGIRRLKILSICKYKLENYKLDETTIYNNYIAPKLKQLDSRCVSKMSYACQEMINNVIEHSEGSLLGIIVAEDYVSFRVLIIDNGIGIFEKIKSHFNLEYLSDAILELDKGKCTTASQNHSGEGIFFSSKMFDLFFIQANGIEYISKNDLALNFLLENTKGSINKGTWVSMEMSKDNVVPIETIFNQYSDADLGFNKTIVPVVHLIDKKNETDMSLMSRSQARRLLHRFDSFSKVILDFESVEFIGQGFADEIFRVYSNLHPSIDILYVNANEKVEQMIKHAKYTIHKTE